MYELEKYSRNEIFENNTIIAQSIVHASLVKQTSRNTRINKSPIRKH